ncbi:Kiwa anti-phage protein KwaB-like domain-containing protein [Methylobacterium brachythecii]|uniref:DUF4868 domain-containing protein n=1 Tax=Methylobacterium brachythecii TaxID=1176177 RepID=A0A7W6ASV3_9HYPH|nr:Kiwa anti-phage protein KwaB-like domain-containing protein [Methylobacterium brachythecii]MBB3905357.1 hypothetical protein [Methylobacterium brachythecii]GLS45895.1 hypothetical protein GCM10007884_38860 [Methylobacterium brachythecii]
MTTLADLKAFDLAAAEVTVWVFKTSPGEGGRPRFSGRWVGITDELAARLKDAVGSCVGPITETIAYDILAQNNEASALTIQADETHAHLIFEAVANPTPARKVRGAHDLANGKFCVARFVLDGRTLLAVRKTDASWSTRRTSGLIRMIYADEELDVDEEPTFAIRPEFDFFVLDDEVFVRSKAHFETVLSYKAGHETAFTTLKAEPAFAGIFTDLGPLNDYVGTNRIHLRRAVAIQQKGLYKDAAFMARLLAEHAEMNLAITFDDAGRIVPTVESGRDIFQALLNHRLESRLTLEMFDVPSTERVG